MILFEAKRLYNKFFSDIQWPYTALLRIFLILISLKEIHVMRSKFDLYFQNQEVFMKDTFLSGYILEFIQGRYELLIYLAFLLGGLAVIGLFSRPVIAVYSILYFIFMYCDISMGIYNHEAGLTAQILFILIFAPGVTSWSVDAYLKNRKEGKGFLHVQSHSNWALYLILLLMIGGYLTAGISKVRYGGMEWLSGETLSYYLSGESSHENTIAQKFIISSDANDIDWKKEFSLEAYTYGNFQTNPSLKELGRNVSTNTFLMSFLAITTVLLEVGAVFMLFSRMYKNLFLLAAIGFHFSIRILMGLGFLDYQVICLCMMDWPFIFNYFKKLKAGEVAQ